MTDCSRMGLFARIKHFPRKVLQRTCCQYRLRKLRLGYLRVGNVDLWVVELYGGQGPSRTSIDGCTEAVLILFGIK